MLDVILQESFIYATVQQELLPRTYPWLSSKVLFYGSAKVGKSMHALSLARSFKHPIYLDGSDARLEVNCLKEVLLKLHLENKMDILIAKHCPPDLFLPPLKHIILIQSTRANTPKGFSAQAILPLNFQEYVCSQKKESPNALFGRFLKEGNSPATLNLSAWQKIRRKQEIYALFLGAQFPLFKALLRFQALNVTIHHLYTQLKKTLKLSKDTFYAFMHFLQESQSIFLIPALESPSKPHKLYFCDFALPYAFSHTHPLPPVFENMVILELIRHFGKLYYQHPFLIAKHHDSIFYFMVLAFPTLENLAHKLKPFEHTNIRQFFLISINFEGTGTIHTLTYHAHSFSTFVLEILPTIGAN
ncbi:ATP-binding protein [Helicobacter salomonis]|uniref:ATP-binding protein n=1 Tax=Helicobacter salomonis TaxID=56878 RepID=UPI000CF0BF48|nr:ATP-binding protein [Helicobacter salomonis]